jgi:hypothetical protein
MCIGSAGDSDALALLRPSARQRLRSAKLSELCGVMSAIGPKRTSLVAPHMSAFGGKADMAIALRNVR